MVKIEMEFQNILILAGLIIISCLLIDCSNEYDGDYVSAYGDTFTFDFSEAGVPGAIITILEYPELSVTTDEAGSFEFHKLIPGTEATFVFYHPDYTLNQTGTFQVGNEDLTRVAFQTPEHYMFDALLAVLKAEVEEDKCQIATTVTRVGLSQYDSVAHGEENATVTIEPSIEDGHGPYYFNASTIPTLDLTETSADGGVAFTNITPGTYTLTAHKEGVEFEQVIIKCRAGYLVNAAPPNGLQALE